MWSHPYNIFNGFENVGAPAIAELDGLPGAEIVHPSAAGLYVFHDDGSLYWYTDTLHSYAFFSSPAIGNLDTDPEPEIAVNLDHVLAIFEPDGRLAWQHTFASVLGMPVLADLTGDGLLDILVHDATTVYKYIRAVQKEGRSVFWASQVAALQYGVIRTASPLLVAV